MRASSSATSSAICSMNQRLMRVSSWSSSTVAPARSASYMMNWRSLVGVTSMPSSSSLDLPWKSLAKPRP